MIQLHDRCLSFYAMVLVRPLLGDAYTALYARPPSKTITLWGYVGLRANEADAYFAAKRSTAWGSDDRDESRRAWGPRRRSIQRGEQHQELLGRGHQLEGPTTPRRHHPIW